MSQYLLLASSKADLIMEKIYIANETCQKSAAKSRSHCGKISASEKNCGKIKCGKIIVNHFQNVLAVRIYMRILSKEYCIPSQCCSDLNIYLKQEESARERALCQLTECF